LAASFISIANNFHLLNACDVLRQEERAMLKHLSIVTLTAALAMGAASLAFASSHKPCPHIGYCKPGTCAQDGTIRACNPKNCSKANCGK
jgi:hypothetical protein